MRKTRGGWRETGRHFSRRHRPLSQVVRVLISLLIRSHYYLRAWHRLIMIHIVILIVILIKPAGFVGFLYHVFVDSSPKHVVTGDV